MTEWLNTWPRRNRGVGADLTGEEMTAETRAPANPDLKKLLELQKTDLERTALEAQVAKLPLDITALDEQLKEHLNIYERHKEQLAEYQKERRRLEGENQLVQEKISKHKNQLYELKSNEQYRTMTHEIEMEEAKISQGEDKILEKMEQAEQSEKLVRESEAALIQQKAQVGEQKKRLEADLDSARAQLQQLLEGRRGLAGSISPEVLASYQGVQKLRGVTAMAEARDGFCAACNVRLRPQVCNEIRTNRNIIHCESCQRILFFVDQTSPQNANNAASQDLAGAGA